MMTSSEPQVIQSHFLRSFTNTCWDLLVCWMSPSFPLFCPRKEGREKEFCSIKKDKGGGDLLAEEAEICLWLTAPHCKVSVFTGPVTVGVNKLRAAFLSLCPLFLLTLFVSILLGFHQTAQGTQPCTWDIKYYTTESRETWQGISKRGWRERRERVEKDRSGKSIFQPQTYSISVNRLF